MKNLVKTLKTNCVVSCLGLCWFFSGAIAQTYPEVSVLNTELRTLHSKLLDQELNLFIKLPASYLDDEKRIYPVLYTTDANRSFPMLANILSVIETQPSPYEDIVLIGIGYKTKSLADWAAWRTRDLTPVNSPSTDSFWSDRLSKATGQTVTVRSGGAENYLDCILSEVIPYAEGNFRISKTDRGLGGYSFGGLFTLYALMKHPDAFQKYFAGSPSIGFGGGSIFEMEKEASGRSKNIQAQVFLTAGDLESTSTTGNIKKMAELLQSRGAPGLKVSYTVFENEDHSSCYPSALMRGIRELYLKKE